MADLNKQEISSPEMQEVMTEIPGSFLKWGLFIFFAIIAILVGGSYFIKNPEVVTVPIVLTTQNPPVVLVAKSGGEIKKLPVVEGSIVAEGDIIAVIGNAADYGDAMVLDRILRDFDGETDWIGTVANGEIPPDLALGEIQNSYIQFQKGWKQLKDYLERAYLPNKMELLEEQINNRAANEAELIKQRELLTEDLAIAKAAFLRDSTLFYKNGYTLSATEFERSRQSYIQKLYSFSVSNTSLKNGETEFLRLKESRLDLRTQYEKESRQFVFAMEESLQLLRSSVSQWEERYVVKSPIAGRVTFNMFRNENQVVKAGETLATVIPETPADIVVRALIPVSGFAKIEIGQVANIKLSGFPYMRYGVLKGRICSLSQVPGEGGFSADIELTGGMTSTYQEKIKFINQMDGTADIITKDERLINKFINPMKGVTRN